MAETLAIRPSSPPSINIVSSSPSSSRAKGGNSSLGDSSKAGASPSSSPSLSSSSSMSSSPTHSEVSTNGSIQGMPSHPALVPQYPYNVTQARDNFTHGHHPLPDDSELTTRLPAICVDYLSHDWAEDDIWASWKSMTKQKATVANGMRLENASWRTWAKQRGKLKTISPETLNWLKDSDVTWLYGPLHTAVDAVPPPKISSASERLGLDVGAGKNGKKPIVKDGAQSDPEPAKKNRRPAAATKPILKYRSLSEILAGPHVTPSSPSIEQLEMDFGDHSISSPDVTHAKSETNLTDLKRRQTPPKKSVRTASPDDKESDASSSGAGPKHEKRHISFNHRVEQCIAVDSPDDAKRYPDPYRSSSSSDDEDDDDDVLTFKSSPRYATFGQQAPLSRGGWNTSTAPHKESEPHTIARLGPTTLKSVEFYPAPSPAVVYQTMYTSPTAPAAAEKPAATPEVVTSAAASGPPVVKAVEAPDYNSLSPYGQPAPTYVQPPMASPQKPTTGRRVMYGEYTAGQVGSPLQWDENEDYAMSYDYFGGGSDMGVADEYDMASYGSASLGGSHAQYMAASAYADGDRPLYSGGPSYGPTGPSTGSLQHSRGEPTSSSNSSLSSPNGSRKSSTQSSPQLAGSPAGGSTPLSVAPADQRGPHEPTRNAGPPKRSILKARSREPSVEESSSPRLGSGGARFGDVRAVGPPSPGERASPSKGSTPLGSPHGSSSAISGGIPIGVRRVDSREGPWERGRSTSRGSSSSLERSSTSDRRASASVSPASHSPPYATSQHSSRGGSRSRGGSSDSLNHMMGSGRAGVMPDLPEASSESDSEAPSAPKDVIAATLGEKAAVATTVGSPSKVASRLKQTLEYEAKMVTAGTEPAPPELQPVPSDESSPRRSVKSEDSEPKFRQPSPSKAAVGTTYATDDEVFDPQSLTNSPSLGSLEPQWSDETRVPSYARRSLLRAARGRGASGDREDGVGRASVDSDRPVSHDDFGFGYYDEEGEAGMVGRTMEIAGTARDLIGALSGALWSGTRGLWGSGRSSSGSAPSTGINTPAASSPKPTSP